MNESQIFTRALQLATPAERVAFLDAVCTNNPQLRADVEALLQVHASNADFLESPALAVTSALPTPTERSGTVIGPYKLLEKIGEGGFGVVFMAEQTSPVKRKVALKVIKPGMDTRQVIARFEAERQALALMDHPHIARVFDAGATDTGRPYFVMELVRGVPITTYCDQVQLPPRQRLELFVNVCQAVQHAHQKGIIHRDIKPSNVLVAQHDDRPMVKVIDFGIAKVTSGQLTDKTLFTGFAQMIGTPLYMSPEQASLTAIDVDTRSDIYSLGVLLYELLTGTTPFDKDRLQQAAFEEIRRIIREEEPQKPSTRLSSLGDTLPGVSAVRRMEPRKLSQFVRGDLDWIVMKALEKDRARRYETANGFATDVLRYLSDEPVTACPPSAGYRFRKFARRNKTTLSVVGLVLVFLVLLGSSVGWAVQERVAASQRAALQRAREQTRLEQRLTAALDEVESHYLAGQLSQATVALRHAETMVTEAEFTPAVVGGVHRWRDDLEMVLRLEKIRLERAMLSDDGKWDWSGADRAYERAFRDYGLDRQAGDLQQWSSRISDGRIAVEIGLALDDWVHVYRRLPNPDEALWRQLLAVAQVADPDPVRNELRRFRGRPLDELRSDIERLSGSLAGQQLQPATVAQVAALLRFTSLTDEAEALLRENQQRHPGDFWINCELGYLLSQQPWAKRIDAPGFYRAALAVRPGNAAILSTLGSVLARLGRRTEAEQAHREAIRLSPNYGHPHAQLGMLFQDHGEWPQAVSSFEEAIRLDPENTFPYGQLVKILTNCPDLTVRNYPRALEVALQGTKLAPNSTWEFQNLGWAEYRMSHWEEAVIALERSCQLQNNGGIGDAGQWLFLAMANQNLGRQEAAREWYRKSFELTEVWYDEIRRTQAEAANVLGIAAPPEQFFTFFSESRSHREEKRWLEVIQASSQAMELAPIQPACLWRNRGQAYLELKQWEAAVHDFTRTLAIAPQQGWVWHLRGRALAGLRHPQRAIADFTKALELNARDWGALGHRGAARSKLNQLDEAIADYDAALAIGPQVFWLWEGRAEVHALRGAWDRAMSDYGRAVHLKADLDKLWRRYFDCSAQARLWDQAVAECDRALTAAVVDSHPWGETSKVAAVAAERDEVYERLRPLRPADRTLRIARIRHLLKAGDTEQASTVLSEVIALAPADHWSWYVAAIVHLQRGAVEDYRQACEGMLRRFSDTPDPFIAARTAVACCLAPGSEDHVARAHHLARRAADIYSFNRWFRLAQAMCEYRAADYSAALQSLEICLAPANESPGLKETAWLLRSLVEHKLDRHTEAQDSFRKAQELIDRTPRADDGLLTDLWADACRQDLLYQETEQLLVLGADQQQAFVVLGGKPVAALGFSTLAAAVTGARDGDTIEIRGNGPFQSKPVAINKKRLTIRAGEGFRPIIQFGANSGTNQGRLLDTNASLVLEGLEIRDGGVTEPAPRYPTVLSTSLAPLYVTNCRFLVRDQNAIHCIRGSVCDIRNCEFLGKPLLKFSCDVNQQVRLENNLLPRAADVPMIQIDPPGENISIRLTRNTILGTAAVQFSFAGSLGRLTESDHRASSVKVESSANIFDVHRYGAQFGFGLADGIAADTAKDTLRRMVAWHQQADLLTLTKGSALKIRAASGSGERFDAARVDSLAGWKQFWGLPDNAVLGGAAIYQGGDLQRRAELSPEQLTPEDFRLRAESAGYRAGSDGKDLGPDVELVGPGPGFERFRLTSEYRSWRTDSGQSE